jgi:hypothetical protein
MSSSSGHARLRTRNQRENESGQFVLVRPDGIAVVLENPQSFSVVHDFEQSSRVKRIELFERSPTRCKL